MRRDVGVLGLGCVLVVAGCSGEPLSVALDAGAADAGAADANNGTNNGATCTPDDAGGPMASTQTVRFQLTNTSSVVAFVASEGSWCAPFEVRAGAGGRLPLSFNGWPECEGPQAPPGSVTQWLEIAPARTATLTWDARRLVPSHYCVDCGARGWSGLGVSEVATGTPVPAPAGSYTALLGVARAIDSACTLQSPGVWWCPADGFGQGQGAYGDAPTCEVEAQVDVTFSLPASGDLTVPVSLQ